MSERCGHWIAYTDEKGFVRHRCSECGESVNADLEMLIVYDCAYGSLEMIDVIRRCPCCNACMVTEERNYEIL